MIMIAAYAVNINGAANITKKIVQWLWPTQS